MLTGVANNLIAAPVDSITPYIEEDLQEVMVVTAGPKKLLKKGEDGSLLIDSRYTEEFPAFMGSGDAVAALRSLPSVATPNDLQSTISIRGESPGSTLFETDGIRLFNPLHMLGMYSAFNPAFYKYYIFRESRIPATEMNSGGSSVYADSSYLPDSIFSGIVSAGLIESHGAFHIPLKKETSSLSIGARQSYLNLIFPNVLKLGESVINYNFTDINTAFTWKPDNNNLIKASIFWNRDAMGLHSDKNGTKNGDFNWSNKACGINWNHKNWELNVFATNLHNKFQINEGTYLISLPSSFTQVTGKFIYSILEELTLETDVNYRNTSLQHNGMKNTSEAHIPQKALEGNLAADWNKRFFSKFYLGIGFRLNYYHCRNFNLIEPLPRISFRWAASNLFAPFVAYGRYVRFERLILESNAGLPTDFWINAYKQIKPEDTHSLEIGFQGIIPKLFFEYNVAFYGKWINNVGEFVGNILNFVNSSYDPLNDYIIGKGKVFGISVSLSRQVGKVRFRARYTYGKSRGYFERYDNKAVPRSTDRPHDLNVNISYSPLPQLTFSGSYILATGTPYTRAKYGYMIGENLIAEYFPHNSSRLPTYKRLDFSATWKFLNKGKHIHSLNLSIYNMLATHNVLFVYTDFSAEGKISTKYSIMKAVIPSLTYTYEF